MSSAIQHKAKVKLARRLRTIGEERGGVGLFYSTRWLRRKFEIAQRVERRIVKARYYKEVKQGVR